MLKWFHKFCQQIFLSDLKGADVIFIQMTNNIKTLRKQLEVVYEETELAIRALDVLGDRVEEARLRIRQRLEHKVLEPHKFSGDDRQRA